MKSSTLIPVLCSWVFIRTRNIYILKKDYPGARLESEISHNLLLPYEFHHREGDYATSLEIQYSWVNGDGHLGNCICFLSSFLHNFWQVSLNSIVQKGDTFSSGFLLCAVDCQYIFSLRGAAKKSFFVNWKKVKERRGRGGGYISCNNKSTFLQLPKDTDYDWWALYNCIWMETSK